jgi:hypothetical protein
MPRVTIDTTEAQSFELVEPGPYPMRVFAAEPTKSSNQLSMLTVQFAFEDPALDKKAGKVFRNYMLEGKGAGFTREFLKATTGEDFPVGQTLDFDTDDVVGKPVTVQITHKEYEGRKSNEAASVVAAQ